MQRRLSRYLLVLGFFIAVAVYLWMGAFVAYPGASSHFLASTLFPAMEETFQYPLDALVFHCLAQWVSPERYLFAVQLCCALCCGFTVALLLSCAQVTVDTAVFDSNENSEQERLRARIDRTRIKRYVTLFSIPLAVTLFPLWVMGTRPLEGMVSMMVAMVVLWVAIILRRRYAGILEYSGQLKWYDFTLVGVGYFWLTFLLALAPSLLIALVLPFLLMNRIFIEVHFRNRLTAVFCALGGLIFGLMAGLSVYAGFKEIFLHSATSSSVTLWSQHMRTGILGIMANLQTLEGACAVLLYALGGAVFLETFPHAFYKAFSPLAGQFSILAMCVLPFIGWPGEYWDGLTEMDPLSALALIFVFLNVILMVASWARNWLDVHAHWSYRKTRVGALSILAAPLLALAGYNTYHFINEANGSLAQSTMRTCHSTFSETLPPHEITWVTPTLQSENLLVMRHSEGRTIQPLLQSSIDFTSILLNGKTWDVAIQEDPLLEEMAALGDKSLIQYLTYSDWSKSISIGDLFAHQGDALAKLAETLTGDPFISTYAGKKMHDHLNEMAAIELATSAAPLVPSEEALAILRRAARIHPENDGVAITIEAMRGKGLPVKHEEYLRARAVYETKTWLEAPTMEQAHAFESVYGPVVTNGFEIAHRVQHLLSGVDVRACVESFIQLYRETPQRLSLDERLFALVHLSEADALPLLEREGTTKEEIVCYLLDNLRTPAAIACYEKHREAFEYEDRPSSAMDQRERSYVTHFYGKNASFSLDYLSRNIKSFYARDGIFSYGLYYVEYLIRKGLVEEAYNFITDFSVRPLLNRQPLFKFYLSRLILKSWIEKSPQKAFEETQLWLQSDPLQPYLWTLHLSNPVLTSAQQLEIARECLAHYPKHPAATTVFAEYLQRTYGDTMVARYLDSVNKATQYDKECAPHAHR